MIRRQKREQEIWKLCATQLANVRRQLLWHETIFTSLLAVFAVSGALAQQLTVTIPGGHDREWYEHHGYHWRDGQWYQGEERERHEYREHHRHNGYWKDGRYYRYEDEDRG